MHNEYWPVLCYHPNLVTLFFAVMLSLHCYVFVTSLHHLPRYCISLGHEPCTGDYSCHVTILCTCTQITKINGIKKWGHAYFIASLKCFVRLLESCKVWWAGALVPWCKILLLHKILLKTVRIESRNFVWMKRKELEKEYFGHLATFWFGTFTIFFLSHYESC